MLRNGLRHCAPEPGAGRGLAGGRGQGGGVERVPGQRPGQVAVPVEGGVQRGRVRDLLLGDMIGELAGREGQAGGGGEAAPLEGVAAGVAGGEQVVLQLEVGEVEGGGPADRVQGQVQCPAEPLGQRAQLGRCRRPVEAADPDVDRVDGPAADQFEDGVAGLLQLQAAFHDVAVIARQRDGVRVAEEVGGVQQVDVQGVAGDPLAAVQQPAQRPRAARSSSTPQACSIALHALVW